MMTATVWDSATMDPTGWYMTEKYDGMRLLWTGSAFYSRTGELVKVPESITSKLPAIPLDGELWFVSSLYEIDTKRTQYGLYQEAVNLSRSQNEERWNKAVFWVFDSPQDETMTLEERIKLLEQQSFPPFVKVVNFVKCTGQEHLEQYFAEVIAKNGEGLVLREPGSVYKAGRSSSLRKYKPELDTEVTVVKNMYPYGLTCKQLDGKTVFVDVKAENSEQVKKLKEGSVVTVKYLGVNAYGTLQFPKFFRERLDTVSLN